MDALQGRVVVVVARWLKTLEKISIIIPVLNEAASLESFLLPLQKSRGEHCEIVVVDGGSHDDSRSIAKQYSDKVLTSPAGRAKQMNIGAKYASGSVLLFLHADTVLPNHFQELLLEKMQQHNKFWGRFDVRLSGHQFMFRVIESLMNLRSCITGIATGDQAIFVDKNVFNKVGRFPEQPLMEDIEISKRLKKIGPPLCLKQRVITSSRRWEEYGIWRTVFLMWQLRLAYFVGTDPLILKRKYQ